MLSGFKRLRVIDVAIIIAIMATVTLAVRMFVIFQSGKSAYEGMTDEEKANEKAKAYEAVRAVADAAEKLTQIPGTGTAADKTVESVNQSNPSQITIQPPETSTTTSTTVSSTPTVQPFSNYN